MPVISHSPVNESDDLQKCGEIMVSAKSNMFAMSCMYCQDIFTRLQSFMRHMHLAHNDKIKFQSTASMAVYAVEELVNRTLCDVDESEESGVAEDDLKWSEDDDDEDDAAKKAVAFKSLYQRGRISIKNDKQIAKNGGRGDVRRATLANMSILEALEDCDVSLNFVANLDTTVVDKTGNDEESDGKQVERKQEEGTEGNLIDGSEENKLSQHEESDEGMDVGEDDCDMDSTLLKRIQLDLDLDNEDDENESSSNTNEYQKVKMSQKPSPNDTSNKDHEEEDIFEKSQDDEDQNVTLTEDNINENSGNSKTGGLKSLLSGLDDLDDVDDLLDNIEDSLESVPKDDEQVKLLEVNKKLPQEFKNSEEEDTEWCLNVSESCERAEENAKSTEHLANDEQEILKPDVEQEDKSQKRVSALELQLMADLDFDENDLEDCLLNSSVAVVNTEQPKSPTIKRKSQQDVSETKTTKAAKCVRGERTSKEGHTQANNNNCIKEVSDTSKSNAGTPKSRAISRKGTHNDIVEDYNKEGHHQQNETSNKEAKNSSKSKKDSRKSSTSSSKLTPVMKSSTKKQKKSVAKAESKVTEVKDLVETNKFEDGLSEENSSTLMYPKNTETPVHNENIIGNSLQALLNKEMGEEEDLDLLINQLETSTSSRECESEMNKTITCDESAESATLKPAKPVENNVEADTKGGPSNDIDDDDDVCSDDEMAIFNKFIGLTSEDKTENEINNEKDEKKDIEAEEEEEDMDDFENLLNEDLSKALERALGDEDNELLNEDIEALSEDVEENLEEQISQENEKDKQEQEKQNDENEKLAELNMHEQIEHSCPRLGKVNKKSTPSRNKNTKSPLAKNKSTKRGSASVEEENYQGKFSKTNQKARHKGKPLVIQENVETVSLKESIICLPSASNQLNKATKPLKLQNTIPNMFSGKQEAYLKQKSLLKTPTPLETKYNQENAPLKQIMIQKTPANRIQQRTPQVCGVTQIKREKCTPARGFINTERGVRTPIKVEDMFMKQSPKTLENSEETQQRKSPLTPKTPEDKHYKKSPSQCKVNLIKVDLIKTANTTKQSPPKTTTDRRKSPTPSRDVEKQDFTTPQKTRHLSVKVQRCTTPSQNKLEIQTSPNEFKSPPTRSPSQEATLTKNSPLSEADREFVANKFKLPRGITISKVPTATSSFPAMVEVTPSRSNYCKQNFTEYSLQQQIQILGEKRQSTESLIKSVVPSTITITKTEPSSLSSRLRARQVSIDIVTGKNHPHALKTPKVAGNLDYKSYAVNRSARKKEVLQRMRHIKKQIFKSIGTDILGNVRTIKSPLVRKQKRSKIQIENVEILPNVKEDVLTPILNSQNLSPSLQTLMAEQSPKSSVSPKRTSETPTTTATLPSATIELSGTLKTSSISSPSSDKECIVTKKTPSTKRERSSTSKTPSTKSPSSKRECSATSKTPTSKSPSTKRECSATSKTPTSKSPTTRRECSATSKTPTSTSPSTHRERSAMLKRSATSPLLEEEHPAKKSHKSPSQQKKETSAAKPTAELESTQLGLSESMVDFLQRDLKANRLNVDSLLHEEIPVDDTTADETNDTVEEKEDCTKKVQEKLDKKELSTLKSEKKEDSTKKDEEKMEEKDSDKRDTKKDDSKDSVAEASMLDDLLEQVDDEQKPNEESEQNEINDITNDVKPSTEYVKDYDEDIDLELLEQVGLKVVKILDIEDFHTLDEVEEMQGKAQKFANVCKSFQKVFSSKQAETDVTFKLLLSNVNQALKADLSLSDIKRLVNIIVMWYANCYNSKLIEKKSISDATNNYLMMFYYIPKTIKRLYYCEFCEEHFNTEHRYHTHRTAHTGATHPYSCKYCHVGFHRTAKQKAHESMCATNQESAADKRELRGVALRNVQKMPMLKTEDQQKTYSKPSENSQLSAVAQRSSKPTVKTIYNCAKCDMSFTVEADVKAHMGLCSRMLRRQPKMCTPRPKPKTEPYSMN